jgi:hypothetical protein
MRIERAFSIKHLHLPPSLFKYRRFCKNHIDALKRSVLWLSSPDRFNDPYEAAVSFDLDRLWVEDYTVEEFAGVIKERTKEKRNWEPQPLVHPIRSDQWRKKIFTEFVTGMGRRSKERLLAYIETFFREHHNEQMERMSRLFRSGFSVLSLSENFSSHLMWAHYSDSHKGFCIEYNLSCLPPDDFLTRFCFPVFYTKKLRDATRYVTSKNMEDLNNLFGILMCLMKKDEWAYEREWRIVDSVGARKANREITMPTPSGIILGLNVRDKDEADMRAFCREQKVPLRKMSQLSGSFELDMVDLRP